MTPKPAPIALGLGTPFAEQIAFLRAKLHLPTDRWDDIARGAHDRAFIVAGAAKADLLADLHTAVARAAEGEGLAAFRKNFKVIVAKHGWTGWTGEGSAAGEAWRTRVIYQTNMATSYAAGRWRQLNEPGFAKLMPYWRYRHADGVTNPRPQHLAWDGLTLPREHAFWKTHFPPNGWNCFPAGVAVRCDARLGLKTWYAGEMVELSTQRGHRLTVTANHPVLTSLGWVRAHELDERHELLGRAGDVDAALVGIVDREQPPALAEDLFEALAGEGLRVASMAAHDFHGDAFLRKPEIHVAGPDRALMDVVQAARREFVGEGGLDAALHGGVEAPHDAVRAPQVVALEQHPVLAQDAAHRWLGDGEPVRDCRLADEAAAIQRQDLAFNVRVARVGDAPRGGEHFLDAAGAGLDGLPAHPLVFGDAAQSDALCLQRAPKQPTGAAGLLRQLLEANPGAVARDKIVDVRKFAWAGHVYDFVTTTGLIVAGGVVVSNCSCKVFAVEAPEPGAKTAPPAGWDRANPATGAPIGIDKGFDYAPGANAATPLRELIDQKLIKLDAPIGAAMWQVLEPALAMGRQAAWWETLDAWLADPLPRGRSAVVGALTQADLNALAAAGHALPESAEIAVFDRLVVGAKERRHLARQDALTTAEWRALPRLLRNPSGVYLDSANGHLVYVADGEGPAKAAVEFAGAPDAGSLNEVVSAFRVSAESIAGMVKGGQWLVVRMPGA